MNANKSELKTVLAIRAKALEYTREWLNSENFVEVQGPILSPAFSERPNHFMVDYFGRRAYLSAGLAPYSDALLQLFDRVYTIAPTFRAERIKSKRHLAEYWRIEALSACTFEDMLSMHEKLLAYIILSLASNHSKELAELNSPIANLEPVKVPFPRLTYDKAVEQLRRNGLGISWGEPITKEMEVALTKLYNQPFFITNFPLNAETVLYRTLPSESLLTYSADLLAPQGYGEIGTCNELVTKKALINKRLTELGIEVEDRKWYVQTRRNTPLHQSTGTIGLERLLQWVCSVEDIAQTTAIPRQYGKSLS